MSDRCPGCGASYALVGKTHYCRGAIEQPAPQPPRYEPSPNISPNRGGWMRNKRWRERNPEAYRIYMRDLMRRKRAQQKESNDARQTEAQA